MDDNIFDFDAEYQDILHEEFENEVQTKTNNDRSEETAIADFNLFSILFECNRDSSIKSSDSIFRKDLDILFNHHAFDIPQIIEIFNHSFEEFTNFNVLIQMARMYIQKISLSSIDSFDQRDSFFAMRESVTKLLLILRCNYQEINDKQLKLLRVAFGTFDSMPNFSHIHSSSCNEGNTSTSSNYHILHGMLEWRWIYLTIIYKIDYFNGKIGNEDCELVHEIQLLIYDLFILSISKFQKHNIANLFHTSPFVCSCLREMWYLIFKFVEKLQDNLLNFWSILSNVLDNIANGKSMYEKIHSKRIFLRSSNIHTCRNFQQYAIWMIGGVVKLIKNEYQDLANDRESYEIFETLIKNYLKIEQTEENMRVLMLLISEVIMNVWAPKSEILMILWEYYQRKINSPFLISGQSPNFMAVSNNSSLAYLEQIKNQQAVVISKLNPNLTSYNMFLYLLGKIVKRFTDEGQQKVQIQKILGRIYTKFPVTKLQQLNEMGIHNILKLFITLSISTNFQDIYHKVTDTLLHIPLEKPNHQQQVMKGHMAMLLLYCENNLNISQYVIKLTNQINLLIQKSSSTNVLKTLSESLSTIVLKNLNDNEELFANGEDVLLDTWIVKYLQSCTTAEQDRLYESLTKIIQRIRILQTSSLVLHQLSSVIEKLFNILLPYAKQTFGKSDSVWMPEMIANLCLLTLERSMISCDVPTFDFLFKTFVDVNSINMEQSAKFITYILKSCTDSQKLDSLVIIQNWIRFSVLLGGSNNEVRELTKSIVNLEEFSSLCTTATCQPEEFLSSKEPLILFIGDIGKKYSASNNQQKIQLIEKIHSYLSIFEKWALPILHQQQQQQQQQNSTQKSTANISVDESVMRIYTFIAITFLHCSELIYVRSKSSCFFNVAVSHFILPSPLMMGQSQPRATIISIHKIWPLLVEGISRLNYKNDLHINKVLSDFVVKWTPHLKISNNSKFVAKPFISMMNLKNLEMIEFVWGKLAKSYIALQPGRKASIHACMILTIIEEVFHIIESDVNKLLSVWRSIMQHVIESAMMLDENEPAQKTCFILIERYSMNRNFEASNTMKEILTNSLKSITDTSLSYHSAIYFRFMQKFLKIQPKIIKNLLPHLMSQIQKVEQLRGSGRDVKLRNFYEQLHSQCRNM